MVLLLADLHACHCRKSVQGFLCFLYFCLCKNQQDEKYKALKSQFTMVITGVGFFNFYGRCVLFEYLSGILLSFRDQVLQEIFSPLFRPLVAN